MSDCRYPNLAKFIDWSFINCSSFASHAGMTEELLQKVLVGQAEIFPREIQGIANMFGPLLGFSRVPLSVLLCQKPILLNNGRYRHQVMMEQLQRRFDAAKANQDRNGTVIGAERRLQILLDGFRERPVYYTAYLATVHAVETVELNNAVNNSRRSLRSE